MGTCKVPRSDTEEGSGPFCDPEGSGPVIHTGEGKNKTGHVSDLVEGPESNGDTGEELLSVSDFGEGPRACD